MLKKAESNDETKYDSFYSHSKVGTIINESDIDDVFESHHNHIWITIYTTIISSIQKSLGKGSGWIIDSVIEHNINISKYNPLACSSYVNLPKELHHPRKWSIDMENIDDNECVKWCLVKYLHPPDHNPRKITKAD